MDIIEQIQRDNEGQESLACCCSWGHKELDNLATEQQQLRRTRIGFLVIIQGLRGKKFGD